jgi:hypothetical protein
MEWYFTTEMTSYISDSDGGGGDTDDSWTPNQEYLNKLLEKLVRGKKKNFWQNMM